MAVVAVFSVAIWVLFSSN